MKFFAAVRLVQVLLAGLYISGTSTTSLASLSSPEVTRILPSASAVPVAYQRRKFIGASSPQVSLCQSKVVMLFTPRPSSVAVPPITITRPSASRACPAQKRSALALGIWTTLPVCGLSTYCMPPVAKSPCQSRILPLGSRAEWIATAGSGIRDPHGPTCEGSLPVPLETVTVIAAEVAMLPAPSRARAERVCLPFAAPVELHESS